jgi:hypothetical protein
MTYFGPISCIPLEDDDDDDAFDGPKLGGGPHPFQRLVQQPLLQDLKRRVMRII